MHTYQMCIRCTGRCPDYSCMYRKDSARTSRRQSRLRQRYKFRRQAPTGSIPAQGMLLRPVLLTWRSYHMHRPQTALCNRRCTCSDRPSNCLHLPRLHWHRKRCTHQAPRSVYICHAGIWCKLTCPTPPCTSPLGSRGKLLHPASGCTSPPGSADILRVQEKCCLCWA